MMNLDQFCTGFGVDRRAAQNAIAKAPRGREQEHPWYVQVMLGFGSWITALLVIAFCCFFLNLVFGLEDDSFSAALAVVGVMFFAAGFVMLRRAAAGVFATHFATALAAAGQAMAAVGIGMHFETVWPSALASVPFTVITAARIESRLLQGLSSAWTVILVFVALHEHEFPFMLEVAALGVAAGVALYLYPPRRDLVPTASVLLLVGPVLSIMFDFQGEFGFAGVAASGWIAQLIFVALILYLLHALWRHATDTTARAELAFFAAAAIAVSAIFPPGAGAALVILVLAFVLGSRVLALIGVLLEIYFLWKFYYDLNLTLLHKSFMLAGVGVVLLALWGLLARLLHKELPS